LADRLLVRAANRKQLDDTLVARRVVKACVVNSEEPVGLYEVEQGSTAERRTFLAGSEAALDALERGDFAQAARQAGQLLLGPSGDGPLLLVLARAADALVRGGAGFDPVWVPPGKR
jgi:hypothetical protein